MSLLRLWNKASRGRRLNIKRVILFPLIVYSVYLLIDSFLPLFLAGFVILLLLEWSENRRKKIIDIESDFWKSGKNRNKHDPCCLGKAMLFEGKGWVC